MAKRTDSMEVSYTASLCRRNALHVLKLAWTTHPNCGFDAAGVRWLYTYIEESQQHLPDDLVDEFVQLAGCFYGECLIAAFGGNWELSNGRLGVHMDSYGFTYPFGAVAKQLANGSSDSIAAAFAAAIEYSAAAAEPDAA